MSGHVPRALHFSGYLLWLNEHSRPMDVISSPFELWTTRSKTNSVQLNSNQFNSAQIHKTLRILRSTDKSRQDFVEISVEFQSNITGGRLVTEISVTF